MNPRAQRALGWLLAAVSAVMVLSQLFRERPALLLIYGGIGGGMLAAMMILDEEEIA